MQLMPRSLSLFLLPMLTACASQIFLDSVPPPSKATPTRVICDVGRAHDQDRYGGKEGQESSGSPSMSSPPSGTEPGLVGTDSIEPCRDLPR